MGIAVGLVYALLAGVEFQQPTGTYVRIALFAALPIAVCAIWIAVILPRLAYLGGGVLRQWKVPVIPTVLVCVGVAAIQYAYSTPLSQSVVDALSRSGGAAAAAACGWLLTDNRYARVIAVALLAAVGALATSLNTSNLFGYAFVVCMDLWWLVRTMAITTDAFPQLRTGTWLRPRPRSGTGAHVNPAAGVPLPPELPATGAGDETGSDRADAAEGLADTADGGPETSGS